MSENKNINLMPEDLRSKEEQVIAKQKVAPGFDLNRPEGVEKAQRGTPTGSSVNIFQRIASIFGRKPKAKVDPLKTAGETLLSAEVKSNGKNHDSSKIDVTERKPLSYQNNNLEAPKILKKEEEIKVRPSPAPKPWFKESNEPSEFMRDIKSTPKATAPLPEAPKTLTLEDIVKPEPIMEPKPVEIKKEVVSPTPVIEKKASDFSIPTPAPIKLEEKPKKIETEKKVDEPVKNGGKFHQPLPRIRAKFLDNDGVDLIPASARIRSWSQMDTLLFITAICALLVVGSFYGVIFYQKEQIKKIQLGSNQQIGDIEREILSFNDLNKEITELGNQIKIANSALNEHIYWTNFFALLEKYTASEVYYKGFTSGNNGGLTLTAIGTDYQSVARQLKVLEQENAKEFVRSAEITSARASDLGVEFNITLVLNPKLFYFDQQ